MAISSVSGNNTTFQRSVPATRSSHDREAESSSRTQLIEQKLQQRAEQQRQVQEKLQHNREEIQRRLDGRLISFGPANNGPEQQVEYNRSRLNEAYNASPYREHRQAESSSQRNEQPDPIDIVV